MAMYEKEINQDLSRPSCQKLKIMVKRHIDQMIRKNETFKPEMKELKQEYW